jgi:hypothetical protein
MKILFALILVTISSASLALEIKGHFRSSTCKTNKAMIWLSTDSENYKQRQLLLHTLVPKGGTFSFYVKPGSYQVRGSDERGCESLTKVSIKDSDKILNIDLQGE